MFIEELLHGFEASKVALVPTAGAGAGRIGLQGGDAHMGERFMKAVDESDGDCCQRVAMIRAFDRNDLFAFRLVADEVPLKRYL